MIIITSIITSIIISFITTFSLYYIFRKKIIVDSKKIEKILETNSPIMVIEQDQDGNIIRL